MKILRIIKHMMAARLSKKSMERIVSAIAKTEQSYMGELRFAVETGLDWPELVAGLSSHERALEVFSELHVWDTEHNSGVLIYLLLADRKVEIVADRGIHVLVGDATWQTIAHAMEKRFRAVEFEKGVLEGIAAITLLLRQHFPAKGVSPDEQPDYPVSQ